MAISERTRWSFTRCLLDKDTRLPPGQLRFRYLQVTIHEVLLQAVEGREGRLLAQASAEFGG